MLNINYDRAATLYLLENENRLLSELGHRGRRRAGAVPILEKASGATYSRTGFKQVNLSVCSATAHEFRKAVFARGLHLGVALDQALFLWANRPEGTWPGHVLKALEEHPLTRLPDVVGARLHPAALGPFLERLKREGGSIKTAARAAIVLWSGLPRGEAGAGWDQARHAWGTRMAHDWSWQAPGDRGEAQASEAQALEAPAQDEVDLL